MHRPIPSAGMVQISGVSRGLTAGKHNHLQISSFFIPNTNAATYTLYIASIRGLYTVMGRNRVSDDVDHVEQELKSTRKSKKESPKPWPLPTFSFMVIINSFTYGEPIDINFATSYEIFIKFFTDDILSMLTINTNEYAQANHHSVIKNVRSWTSTTKEELRIYIGAYIYMKVYDEATVNDYWRFDSKRGLIHEQITKHISQRRWQQINRYFHIFPSNVINNYRQKTKSVFDKLKSFNEHLRSAFKAHWRLETHLTINESI